ncbi:MAG: PQQ-binding-like beta-propeller repeat protein [Planctomycetota bacterium]
MNTPLNSMTRFSLVSLLLAFVFGTSAWAQYPEIQWWVDLDAPSFGSAATADIDKDGMLEIVFGTYFNDEKIHALNAEDGSTLWSYDTGGCNDASPVIYDVDQDGDLEVVVPGSSPCKVYCFDGATGVIEWTASTGSNCIDSPPAVADLDLDGKPEVVLGTFHGYVYCLNGEDGSQCWKIGLGTNSYIQSGPNLLDLDGDGNLDVVVAQWAGDNRVYALKGTDGSELWHSDLPTDWMYHGGSFGDIDHDGKPEIAIGCYDSKVYCLSGENGRLEWQYTTPWYVGAPTNMADVDNDNYLEVIYNAYNQIGALNHDGTKLWTKSTTGGCFRGTAIADVNNDGQLDLAFGTSSGILAVLRGDNGTQIWSINLQAHYGQAFDCDHAPIIADFDNDGKLDIFIVGGYGESTTPTNNHGRAYMLSAGDGTGMGWTQFRGDCRHSACYDGYRPLDADRGTLSAASGGDADFYLKAGFENAGRNYILLGSLSGTDPGTALPQGLAKLPLNWDLFTDLVFSYVNTAFFQDFLGQLDSMGKHYALFDTLGGLPPTAVGLEVQFAFALNNFFDFVSNPVRIEVVP